MRKYERVFSNLLRLSMHIETLINEKVLLLAKFLRDERKTWIPRIAIQ